MTKSSLQVLAPQAFSFGLDRVAREFERTSQVAVTLAYGPAAGPSDGALTTRLAKGEAADVVLLPTSLLTEQVRLGFILASPLAEVMRSCIGMCVRQGSRVPDISTVSGLVDALLSATSVALSTAGSGEYIATRLFPRLGIEAEMNAKCRRTADEPVANCVARGEAELGFQQICELLPVSGITYAGALPAEIQHCTPISAGVVSRSLRGRAALQWIDYLRSSTAALHLTAAGLDAITPANQDGAK